MLFVDDMADMGALIVDMLRLEGFDADWCASGADAALRVDSGRYGILITDLFLDGTVDGEALARRALAREMPALVISGDAGAIDRLKLAGFEAALKPVDVDRIIDWLRHHGPTRAAAG